MLQSPEKPHNPLLRRDHTLAKRVQDFLLTFGDSKIVAVLPGMARVLLLIGKPANPMFLPSFPCDGFFFGKRDLSRKARGRFGRSRSSELRRACRHGGALVECWSPGRCSRPW